MSKMLLLTLNEQEEKIIDKIIAALADHIQLEPMQITPASVLSLKPFGTWKAIAAIQALST